MRVGNKRVMLCNCEASMALDGKGLARACASAETAEIHTQLCGAQRAAFLDAARAETPLLVACTQQAPLFAEWAEAEGRTAPLDYVNIRERAGWSKESQAALPKIAALLATAVQEVKPAPAVSFASSGDLLILGRDAQALEVAEQLRERLAVTVLLDIAEDTDLLPPARWDIGLARGRVARLSGHLGAFAVTVDRFAEAVVSSRDRLRFGPPRDGATTSCDLVLDLTGGSPLITAHAKRDGYLRVDPQDPVALQRTCLELTGLIGEFEKPRYVDFKADLCVHARSNQTGCTRCLDVCPAAAIQPAGEVVAIDAHICAGCGGCAAVCPTGAADYAVPYLDDLFEQMRTLLDRYLRAGGRQPVLLLHDQKRGAEALDLIARLGDGLPARVLPLAVNETTQIGLAALAAGYAYGAADIVLLLDPTRADEEAHLAGQRASIEACLDAYGHGAGRTHLLPADDPDAVADFFWSLPARDGVAPASFAPMGGKRTLMRLALDHLHNTAPTPQEIVALPEGAPFGRVSVDAEGCTLCLACVAQCPTGALLDNEDKPQLRFVEDACVQCGICAATCPENVIRLEPRYNAGASAKQPVIYKEEEPFACVRCGQPFGVASTVNRIVERLAARHWMFQDPAAVERIKMCDDCRVKAQFEDAGTNPFARGERPRVRTTDDYRDGGANGSDNA